MISVFLLTNACRNTPVEADQPEENIPFSERQMPADFNYSTKNEIQLQIFTCTPAKKPLTHVRFSVYDGNPENGANKLISGITDAQGRFERILSIASTLKELVITTNYIGLINRVTIPIEGETALCDYGNLPKQTVEQNADPSGTLSKAGTAEDYAYLGNYDNEGTPEYLHQPGDEVSQEFLDDINASLPEMSSVPENNPEYLADGKQINTLLSEPADVFVTFVHEGAGYRNVLGFYSYPADNPPASRDEIDSITIVFPNVSFVGSGGGLHSGDKVYIGHFPANTEIGWMLIADGWRGSVTEGKWKLFSDPSFNPEPTESDRQHNVLLYDDARDLTVLGFEDIRRDYSSCDNDFNDALFYVTSNPRTAIVNDNVSKITHTGDDSDGDGVNDPVDDYPDDPTKAYDNFYPAENTFGSLAFEDLWPNKGDYDFNDQVVDYSFKEVMNANNEVTEIEAKFIIKAIGASYENGFGFELPIDPSLVQSVSGSVISGSAVTLASNGLEAAQDNAVVIVFDNAYNIISRPQGYYVNTQKGAPHINPDTVTTVIVFNNPVSTEVLGNPPYNPFIFINQHRDREVHLPGYAPTTLAAESGLFDTGDDNSSASGYYKTKNNLPWALDIVSPFDYPFEKISIDKAHKYFVDWAESSGQNYSDWYKDNNGYRVLENIYSE